MKPWRVVKEFSLGNPDATSLKPRELNLNTASQRVLAGGTESMNSGGPLKSNAARCEGSRGILVRGCLIELTARQKKVGEEIAGLHGLLEQGLRSHSMPKDSVDWTGGVEFS